MKRKFHDYIPECPQDLQIRNLDLLSNKATEPTHEHITPNALDLSCKKRTSSPTNIKNSTDTYSSLTLTTSDRYEQPTISTTERHSPYATVLMSPYSETNSPKRRKLNEPTATMNSDFTNNSSNQMDVSAAVSLMYHPPYFLQSSEAIGGFSREMLTSSSLPMSFAQVPQSVPISEATRMIPQTFSPIPTLQPAVPLPRETNLSVAQTEMTKKVTRPFKAYGKDSIYFNKEDNAKFQRFRHQMKQSFEKMNENPNPKMRRANKSPALPNSTVEEKDAAYWERRKKNNAAAKRSRDARRQKEDELAIKAVFFERENQRLKNEIQFLRSICLYNKINIDSLRTQLPYNVEYEQRK
ncbi:hypothetical protein DMN91_004712 [Ooceraea biroi]|uniref:Thyrotroph embryonic factor n=1 Tax=Ooceraea biroi TaxID=2015173 RepID=A0A026W0L9_OOCBI|nr:probable serine/threonine-protein kinase nek3 [Ooceraea biroi]EZA49121.1 Thyrotroph embryonic factor [Ooceraea biroi]RLU22434.1 hypothetical protein DMN91_004712 [Ooceraea biroi]